MRSIADDLRSELRRRESTLPAAERLERALRLGEEALAAYAEAHRLTRREAARALDRNRQRGRRRSRCHAELLE